MRLVSVFARLVVCDYHSISKPNFSGSFVMAIRLFSVLTMSFVLATGASADTVTILQNYTRNDVEQVDAISGNWSIDCTRSNRYRQNHCKIRSWGSLDADGKVTNESVGIHAMFDPKMPRKEITFSPFMLEPGSTWRLECGTFALSRQVSLGESKTKIASGSAVTSALRQMAEASCTATYQPFERDEIILMLSNKGLSAALDFVEDWTSAK